MKLRQLIVCVAVAFGLVLALPWVGATVDLEPRSTFDPECSAAEKELRWTREERAKARIGQREAKSAYEACKLQVIQKKKRNCRVEDRNLGAAVSRLTRASEEFKRASTRHRQICVGNKEYGGGR